VVTSLGMEGRRRRVREDGLLLDALLTAGLVMKNANRATDNTDLRRSAQIHIDHICVYLWLNAPRCSITS